MPLFRFLIVLLFIPLSVYAQNPESPRIDFVSVHPEFQKPQIRWSHDNPQNIDGYLIKRFIYDFQNTYGYNTVEIIEDPYAVEFIDSTTVYGEALPGQRSEIYRIAAYDSVGDERFLSPMSEPHATVFLSGAFDYCQRSNRLEWTNYTAWKEDLISYAVFESADNDDFRIVSEHAFGDTLAYEQISQFNINYQYYIQAENAAGFVSRSNIIDLNSDAPEFPDSIQITEISNEQAGSTIIKFSIAKIDAVESFVLLAEKSDDSKPDSLEYISADGAFEYEIRTPRYSDSNPRDFRLIALDTCPVEVGRSREYTELLIEARESKQRHHNTIRVIGRTYLNEFIIYRRFNDAPFEMIDEGIGTVYEDDRSQNLRGQLYGELPQGFFYYRFEAWRQNTRYISNVSSIFHEAKLMKYNALNPKSNYEQDNVFKPFAAYLSDYKMTIYHPDGYIIFESSDPQTGWKATFSDGTIVPRGTYIYYIRYTDASGKQRTEKDYVTVVY